jgi:hypothetical protein
VLRAMHDDHVELSRALSDLAELARGGEAAAVRAAFVVVEAELRRHLAFEEEQLLPRFAEGYPAEAALLREEHQRIRRRLDELGIALELHSLRADMVDELTAQLRDHAQREERLFYDWSDGALRPPERHALFHWAIGRLEARLARRN